MRLLQDITTLSCGENKFWTKQYSSGTRHVYPKSEMLTFNAVALATIIYIAYFRLDDVSAILRKQGQDQMLRMPRLQKAIENALGNERQTAKRVILYNRNFIDPGIMRTYSGNYEVCGRIANCVSHPPVQNYQPKASRVVIVSPEGFLHLLKRFAVSFKDAPDLINIVIWDESRDASELCRMFGVVHQTIVAAGRDEVRRCFTDQVSRNQSWSPLSGKNVTLGCGICMGLDLCSLFGVKILAEALSRINATVIRVPLIHVHPLSIRYKVDVLGLLTSNMYLCPAFLIEPELDMKLSFYVYVDAKEEQKMNFLDTLVADFNTFGFLVLVSFLFAALFLVLNRRLLGEGLDDLLLLLYSHSVAAGVEVSTRCLRGHSRRVLVVFWALGCLAFGVYVRCLVTATESIPNTVNKKELAEVVHEVTKAQKRAKFCFTGEEIAYIGGYDIKMLTYQISGRGHPCNRTWSYSCFLELSRGAAFRSAMLLDPPSCEVRKKMGDRVFSVNKDMAGIYGGIPISRSSPLKLLLKALVRRMYETGWYGREYLSETKMCGTPITQHEMYISFWSFLVAYLSCISACVLVFLLELIISKWFLRYQYFGRTRQC